MKSGFTHAWIPILIVAAILATDIGLALYLRSYSPSSLRSWFPFPFFPLLFITVVFLSSSGCVGSSGEGGDGAGAGTAHTMIPLSRR
jgi:hypothetical protein